MRKGPRRDHFSTGMNECEVTYNLYLMSKMFKKNEKKENPQMGREKRKEITVTTKLNVKF